MESFTVELNTFFEELQNKVSFDEILPEGKIRPDVALIELNIWISQQSEVISTLPGTKKNSEQVKNNIAFIARQFPVVWNEKDLSHHVRPHFKKEEYIAYLSSINNSYKNLPLPNYSPPFSLYNLPNYEKKWCNITLEEFTNIVTEKTNNGKDFYGLSFLNLDKLILKFPEIAEFIVKCYNNIINGNYNLCAEWCSSHIAARYKGGDKADVKRFRPLMVLPIIVRIMDCILSRKLHDIILKYNIIDTRVQKAIMKNSSGLWENVFDVNMRISKIRDDQIFLFIDLVNAFGSVNYRTMLTILQKYNFSPEFSTYFERYYKNVFGIYQSESFKWKDGLFQGSALSNIFFLIYIDFCIKNLFQDLKSMQIIDTSYDLQDNSFAFVDDIVIILKNNERLPRVIEFMTDFLTYYGFKINEDKTYFVIKDKSVDSLCFNEIVYKKADPEFHYLGHSLFIFQEDVLTSILEKLKKCLTTIESFNISGKIKAYIYYSCIFTRISRILETFYLINGRTHLMDKIMEQIGYFIYRWGGKDYLDYGRKHFEHIYSKGMTKLNKSPNLQEYLKTIEQNPEIKQELEENDFKSILGYDSPDFDVLEDNLKTMKSNNYFPIEHYEKNGSCFYADNFVSWIE